MSEHDPRLRLAPSHANWRMPPRSRFAGQLIDASSRRSIKILTLEPDEPLITDDANHAVVDFFYHEGEFFRAVIPLDAVDRIVGHGFNFSKPKMRQGTDGLEILLNRRGVPRPTVPTLNHVQSRFILKPDHPIELYRMDATQQSGIAYRIDDFIYSLEVAGPKNSRFNLRDGLMGNFINAHRFLSTQEMVFERLVLENQYIAESPPLSLSGDEKRKLLVESLLRSHRAGMNELYYLLRICGTNNCTSGPFQILDKVIQYNWRQWIGARLYRLPLNPRFYLRVRGLDSDPSFRKLLTPEFEDYVRDPATQQRRKDYLRQRNQQQRTERETSGNERT